MDVEAPDASRPRNLATLATIESLHLIPGPTRSAVPASRGWDVVVRIDNYAVGDRCGYLESTSSSTCPTASSPTCPRCVRTDAETGREGHVLRTARRSTP